MKTKITLSLLMLLALAGGALGCLISLPLNGVATGTFSWTTFAEVAFEFRITPELLAEDGDRLAHTALKYIL